MVIQACQDLSPTKHGHPVHSPPMLTTSAQLSDPGIVSDPAMPSQVLHIDKHIILTRPHTTPLLATVSGEEARREAITGAHAEQIRAANGETEICVMFNRAVRSVKRSNPEKCANQWAELRKVGDKSLILPPATKNGDTQLCQQ